MLMGNMSWTLFFLHEFLVATGLEQCLIDFVRHTGIKWNLVTSNHTARTSRRRFHSVVERWHWLPQWFIHFPQHISFGWDRFALQQHVACHLWINYYRRWFNEYGCEMELEPVVYDLSGLCKYRYSILSRGIFLLHLSAWPLALQRHGLVATDSNIICNGTG